MSDTADNRFYRERAAPSPEIVCAACGTEREELAMMIRMLVSSLKRHWPYAPHEGDLPSCAIGLLRRRGLMGSVLRDDEPKCEVAHPPQVNPSLTP